MQTANEYLIENRLQEDPSLHQLMRASLFAIGRMLQSYAVRFPSFTDHSMLHSLNVLRYCNCLVGRDRIAGLNAQECYVLIMSCYLHDIGMGIGDRDYAAFFRDVVPESWIGAHPDADEADVVRSFHQEFSGRIIQKYAGVFEIPEEYVFPIVQVSRGHRKTDLFDEREYPVLTTHKGILRLPYLAAVIRLADELDWEKDRNPDLLFRDIELRTWMDYEIFGIHESIQNIHVDEEKIVLTVKPKTPEFLPLVEELAQKIDRTLAYCKKVAEKCAGLRITQKKVEMILPENAL